MHDQENPVIRPESRLKISIVHEKQNIQKQLIQHLHKGQKKRQIYRDPEYKRLGLMYNL